MSTVSRREVQPQKRVVWSIPLPSNWAELAKLCEAVERDARENGGQRAEYDDFVKVEADEDELRLWFEEGTDQ